MNERVQALIELLHEMMSELFAKVGDVQKATLLQRWHDFYEAWTTGSNSEANDNDG